MENTGAKTDDDVPKCPDTHVESSPEINKKPNSMVTIELDDTMAKYPVDRSLAPKHADPKEGVKSTDAGMGVGPLGSAPSSVRFDSDAIPSDGMGKKSVPTESASLNAGPNGNTSYSCVEEVGKDFSHCEKPDPVMVRVAVLSFASREHRTFPTKKGGLPTLTKLVPLDDETLLVLVLSCTSGGKTELDNAPDPAENIRRRTPTTKKTL